MDGPRGVRPFFFAPSSWDAASDGYARSSKLCRRPAQIFSDGTAIELMRNTNNQGTALLRWKDGKFEMADRVEYSGTTYTAAAIAPNIERALRLPARIGPPENVGALFRRLTYFFLRAAQAALTSCDHSASFRRVRVLAVARLADRADPFDLRASRKSQDPHFAAAPLGVPPPALHCRTHAQRTDAPPLVACSHFAIGRTGFETQRSNDLARLESAP